ncbi:MAG: hypothetical protein P8182_01465 [Deltaproteobacteria bacterium]
MGVSTPRVLGELIEDRVKRNENKIFLRFKDLNVTYGEMNRSPGKVRRGGGSGQYIL